MRQIPDPAAVGRVLQQWRDEAAREKDATFSEWTFLDTNCLSELVKLARGGESVRVHRFLCERDILIPSTVLQELRRAPDIATGLTDALAPANIYLLPHPTDFFKCDLWNFLNVKGHRRNILEVTRLHPGLFGSLDSDGPHRAAWERAEARARDDFPVQINRDRKAGVDERKLIPMVWGKVNELAQRWFQLELPVAECRPDNFPSFFVYYFAYYFRYLTHARVVPHPNDFIDLAHAVVAPYCTEFYTERKLALILRNQIQGRRPPTPYAATKHLFNEGIVDAATYEKARRSEDMRRETTPLLGSTRIGMFSEFRALILAA